MKLFAPEYYKEFTCIADKCKHSCCIGWEIDVDGDTMEKYKSCREEYGKNILESIEDGETPCFRLGEAERCPHLNDRGLCRIILEVGEDYLCHICREHPRFYNDSPKGREVGLGMACEEACRIILFSDGYRDFKEIAEVCGQPQDWDFDTLVHRERIYGILCDRSRSYTERLERIYEEYGVTPSAFSDEEWIETLESLEYLNSDHKELFESYSSVSDTPQKIENQLERALAYFVYRHCTEAEDAYGFCAALGFCLFCERLIASLCRANEGDITDFARIVSEELEYSVDNTEEIKAKFEFLTFGG